MAGPRVAVIGTGGTISSVGRHGLDLVAYLENNKIYEVDELLNAFPETLDQGDVVPVRLRAMPSTAIGPAEWLEINEKIHQLVNDDPALQGIVVTHGTATLEETAYFLNLVAKVDIPVVLVGAQRPASGMGTDSGINIVNAIAPRTPGFERTRCPRCLKRRNSFLSGHDEDIDTSPTDFQEPRFRPSWACRLGQSRLLPHAGAATCARYRIRRSRHDGPTARRPIDDLCRFRRHRH